VLVAWLAVRYCIMFMIAVIGQFTLSLRLYKANRTE
jgi:hypothetical protein